MSSARLRRSTLLPRAWSRAAAAPLAAAALAALVAPALLGDAPPPPPSPPAPALASESPPPPPDRPTRPPRAPVEGLPELAARWRLAVIEGQRQQVLALTAALRASEDAPALLGRLAADPHERVRAYAVRELGRRRDRGLRDVLLAARGDPSPHVRENADWALTQLEAP